MAKQKADVKVSQLIPSERPFIQSQLTNKRRIESIDILRGMVMVIMFTARR